jgi:hypothetical protein
MSEQRTGQDVPQPGEPGAENRPAGSASDSPSGGAQRRVEPGPPEPGSNQGKAEPVGEGNVSPGAGSYGSDHGSSGVGIDQPDRLDRGTTPAVRPAGGEGGSLGPGEAYRQPQRYGESPEPIATDNESGARVAAPGGPVTERPVDPTTGNDADATYGLQTDAMPGTSQDAAAATGIRRAVFEGDGGDSRGALSTGDGPRVFGGDDTVEPPEHLTSNPQGVAPVRPEGVLPDDQVDTRSSAAAAGEALRPDVEQPAQADTDPMPHHERPVTGAHRRSAPSGEVGSQ